MRKFLIHIPCSDDGGCESLHQLSDALINLKQKCFVTYFPAKLNFEQPKKFLKYRANHVKFFDDAETMHVIPEVKTNLALKIKKGKVCIFWLSVDNYFPKKEVNMFQNIYNCQKLFYFLNYDIVFCCFS